MTPYFVILALLIALAPAFIAHGKGRNFLLWWLYGVLLGPVALIHSILLRNPRRPTLDDPLYEDESSWVSPWPLLLRVGASLAIAVVAVALYRLFVPPEFDSGSGSREVAVSTDRTAPGQRLAPAPSAVPPALPRPAEAEVRAKSEPPKPAPAPSPTVNVTVREDAPPAANTAKNGEQKPPAAPAPTARESEQAAASAAPEPKPKPEMKPAAKSEPASEPEGVRSGSKSAAAGNGRAAEPEIVPPPPPPPSPATASTERLERTAPAATLERTVAEKAEPEAAPAPAPAPAKELAAAEKKTGDDASAKDVAKEVKKLAARPAPPETAAPSPPDPVISAPAPREEMLRGETEAQPARRKPASRKAAPPASASTPPPAPPASDVTAVGDIVRMVQQALVERGYDPGPVNGRAGRETEQAIRKFQEDRGLNPTGSIDYTVLETLNIVGPRVHAFQPPPGTAPGR